MSRIINLANSIDRKKAGKYSLALNKKATVDNQQLPLADSMSSAETPHAHPNWIIRSAITLMLLGIIGLNLKLFFAINKYEIEKDNIFTKLIRAQDSINSNMQLTTAISGEVKQLDSGLKATNSKIKDNDKKFTQLETQSDSQAVAILNLAKAKNTLLNRINSLEVELEALKKANEKLDNSQAH